jgi:ribosome-binding factor A
MPAHRPERVAEAIREVVAQAILFEMADPRVKGVTVTRVEASGDLRNATVHVSVMGTESQQKQTLGALRHGAGFLQSKVAARLQTRFTPVLAFKKDDSIKRSIAVGQLIDQIAAERQAGEAANDDDLDQEDDDLDLEQDQEAADEDPDESPDASPP